MKKIIFIDVDGTLVDYDNVLPLSAVKAIRKARANGHKVYISRGSRGRSFSCVSAAGTDLMQSIMY